jgi:hypothetical protein
MLLIGEVLGLNLDGTPTILTEVFYGVLRTSRKMLGQHLKM